MAFFFMYILTGFHTFINKCFPHAMGFCLCIISIKLLPILAEFFFQLVLMNWNIICFIFSYLNYHLFDVWNGAIPPVFHPTSYFFTYLDYGFSYLNYQLFDNHNAMPPVFHSTPVDPIPSTFDLEMEKNENLKKDDTLGLILLGFGIVITGVLTWMSFHC
jgi:hypothetical protein